MVTELLSLIGPAGQMVRVLLSSDWLSELFTGASFPLTPPPSACPSHSLFSYEFSLMQQL